MTVLFIYLFIHLFLRHICVNLVTPCTNFTYNLKISFSQNDIIIYLELSLSMFIIL